MKKHLIAAAVAAAVAVPAAAQVTVYGTINAGISSTKTETSGVSSTSTTQGGEDYTSTSVIGFKGTEDLGGGLKALFDLQADLNPGNGQVGSTSSAAGGQVLFNRLAYVGIEGGFGRVTVGRLSDAVDSLEGYANHYNLFDTETAGANGIGGKNANSTRYDSPAFMGARLIASYSSNATATGATGTETNTGTTVSTVGVTFAQGAISLGAARGEANAGTSKKGEVSTVYAGYVMGPADIRVQYTSDETSASVKNTTSEGSVNFQLGNGLSFIVHAESGKFNGTNTGTTADYKQLGALLRKDLSKRTHGYVGYRSKDREAAASTDETVATVGISHSF
jgi:predicted porin